jgi:hypothetical protein
MTTIVSAITVSKQVRPATTRYRFRYTLSNGEVQDRIAWVSNSVDEAAERDARGVYLLEEMAVAEFNTLLGDL